MHVRSSIKINQKINKKIFKRNNLNNCRHQIANIIKINVGDPVFEIDATRIKYGPGVLKEVGNSAKHHKLKRVIVFTDKFLREYEFLDILIKSLKDEKIEVIIFDEISIEPTDTSFKEASKFAFSAKVDGFISLGGGSVIDTCKAANLYSTYPPNNFLEYVNPPIGLGKQSPDRLKIHIACPTTSGTGSESTGLAIFDLQSLKVKTGIVARSIRPDLAVIDPFVTKTLPKNVCASSAFDVLSHAIESYTALPHTRRQIVNSQLRPISQGANMYADVGALQALHYLGTYMERAVHDPSDFEARDGLLFASMLAGLAFGNVGCHLPHGLSYPVAGNVNRTNFQPVGYPRKKKIIPHGFSVMVNSPSCFRYTALSCPNRHLKAAEALGADIRTICLENSGDVLSERMIKLMKLTNFPNGLYDVGYYEQDIDDLVKGAWPQQRLITNTPMFIQPEDIQKIYQDAIQYW